MAKARETIGAYEAKTKLPELLERAASGESITITKHNQPVARLIPFANPIGADLQQVFQQMDEICSRSKLNSRGSKKLTIKDLIEEGRN